MEAVLTTLWLKRFILDGNSFSWGGAVRAPDSVATAG